MISIEPCGIIIGLGVNPGMHVAKRHRGGQLRPHRQRATTRYPPANTAKPSHQARSPASHEGRSEEGDSCNSQGEQEHDPGP